VRPKLEQEILERIAQLSRAPKSIFRRPQWKSVRYRSPAAIELVTPLAIEGAVVSGLQARLTARSDMPDRDLYAQLENWCPQIEKYLHFDRVEWRPVRPHTNPPTSPARVRGLTLWDRRLPFSLNRRLGIPRLLQIVTLIAEPISPELTTFTAFCEYLGRIWSVENASSLPEPPWQERLL
jgi:hypothetical protein